MRTTEYTRQKQLEPMTILVAGTKGRVSGTGFLVVEKDAQKNGPRELTGRRMCCHPTRFCHPHDKI
jgi:hypothetical protein